MARVSLEPLRSMDGYVASALVDADSGMMLAGDGAGVNLEVAAAGNSEVVRAKRKVANNLKLNDTIEDILISLTKQYHIIRPLESAQQLFLYVVLDRGKANLAMARHEIRTFEKSLDFG
ncbi:MAG: roadblock/LC7 domain-containing protein [Lysobacteraceae bacterium]